MRKAYEEMCKHFLDKYPEKGEVFVEYFKENDLYSWAIEVVSNDNPTTISRWQAQAYRQCLGLDVEDEEVLYKWLYNYYSR